MAKFRENDVEGSVGDFDAGHVSDTQHAALPVAEGAITRGLSLYYMENFEDASKQFRDDVAVNPNDTEESIWAFLSDAQLMGVEGAQKQFLENGDPNPDRISGAIGDEGSKFYGLMYVGLWYESRNNMEGAKDNRVD
eukprot:gene31853-7059_t